MDPWQITIFTVAAAGAATLLMLAPGLLLAWLLARGRFRGRVLLDTLISLPLVMPPVATGLVLLTLLLYSAGNLIMLRLVREFGMASAFSLSAVIQLVAVNVIALAWFGEKLGIAQSAGVCLAIFAVGLITLGPFLQK